MRILVLSFYYPPDLGAGAPRTAGLVDALRQRMPSGSAIDVITTRPNRYASFVTEAASYEEQPGISIRRIPLGSHKSGMIDQSFAFASFARGANTATATAQYDIVVASSARLMTAVLGAWIARRQKAKLYLDIRDIFVDTIQDVIGGAKSRPIKLFSEVLERFAVRQAAKVNLVSPGFLEYFVERYPHQRFSCFTNGVDDEFLDAGPRAPRPLPRHAGNGTLTVLYAGNIGEGQGLHQILPRLAKQLDGQVRFQVVGDGGRRGELESALRAAGSTNVAVFPPVPREQLVARYRAADVLFLHLNDYPAFEKVLPSKLFEYAAMGKPVLAGVGGFAADFVRSEIPNAGVFRPCDVGGAVEAFRTLKLEEAPREAFVTKYGRAAICRQMAGDVLSVMAHNP